MTDLPTSYPLRDLFDAAVRNRNVKLTCLRCRHSAIFDAHALWWHFHRRGWNDRFADVQGRGVCTICFYRHRERVRSATIELVDEPPTDSRFPLPSELDWKRELRHRR